MQAMGSELASVPLLESILIHGALGGLENPRPAQPSQPLLPRSHPPSTSGAGDVELATRSGNRWSQTPGPENGHGVGTENGHDMLLRPRDPDAGCWFNCMTLATVMSTVGVGIVMLICLFRAAPAHCGETGAADDDCAHAMGGLMDNAPPFMSWLVVCDYVVPGLVFIGVTWASIIAMPRDDFGVVFRRTTWVLIGSSLLRVAGLVMATVLHCHPAWDRLECLPVCFFAFIGGFGLTAFLMVAAACLVLAVIVCLFERT